MTGETQLFALTHSIYEAVLNSDLWPSVLIKLADVTGAAQIAMPSFDWRADIFTTIAPRFDPELVSSYKENWAFREPIVPRARLRPVGEAFTLDDLMPREEFAATPVFNEWWQRAGCGLAAIGANLVAEDQFSALICLFNAPAKDALATEQVCLFDAVLPHIRRAVRMSRHLWGLDLKHLVTNEPEMMQHGALLVDASARVIVANSTAQSMLAARDGIFLCKGRLAVLSNPDALQKLVVSCTQTALGLNGPGGELTVLREMPRSPFHVTVAPLRSNTRLPNVPWVGSGSPVAIVTVTDNELDRHRRELNLRRRFEFTSAEAALAIEILKGDGRRAAAQRCGISEETAKTYLRNIFEKTGTRRQAELVRVLLGATGT